MTGGVKKSEPAVCRGGGAGVPCDGTSKDLVRCSCPCKTPLYLSCLDTAGLVSQSFQSREAVLYFCPIGLYKPS